MTELDFRILDFIREHFSSGPMDAAMKFFTFLGEAGWFWILIGIVLAAIPKTRRTGVTVLAALLLSLIVCNLTIKPLVGRIRPYDLREGIELMIAGPTDFSFPSGHASASCAAAAAIFAYHKKWGAGALALAAVIAFSRLYLYVHYPSDVLAGSLLGILFGVISYYIVKTVFERIGKKRGSKNAKP